MLKHFPLTDSLVLILWWWKRHLMIRLRIFVGFRPKARDKFSERTDPRTVLLTASKTRLDILKFALSLTHQPGRTMDAEILPNGTATAKQLKGSGMPWTEYSASPTSAPSEKSKASASIPPEFLLPNGYPDV